MFDFIKRIFKKEGCKHIFPRNFEQVEGDEVFYGTFEIRRVNYYGLCGITTENVVLPLTRIVSISSGGGFTDEPIRYPKYYKLLFVHPKIRRR